MDMKVKTLGDAIDFARLAKDVGAHGIFLYERAETISGFIGFLGSESINEPITPTKTFRFRLCTSIGTVYGAQSTNDTGMVQVLETAIQTVSEFFPVREAKISDSNDSFNLSFEE